MRGHFASAIVATGVCVSFGEAIVLDYVDLTVAEGIPDELKRRIPDSHTRRPFATREALIPAERALALTARDEEDSCLQGPSDRAFRPRRSGAIKKLPPLSGDTPRRQRFARRLSGRTTAATIRGME